MGVGTASGFAENKSGYTLCCCLDYVRRKKPKVPACLRGRPKVRGFRTVLTLQLMVLVFSIVVRRFIDRVAHSVAQRPGEFYTWP